MKNRILLKWGVGMCLTVLPFAGGCLRAGSDGATNVGAAEVTPVGATNSNLSSASNSTAEADAAALEAAKTNAPAVDISQAKIRPVEEGGPLPGSVRSVGPAGELLKLASSGIDETVILSFITNSTSVFSLSADEIIYLKDLGISGDVITAAIQKDQELKAAGVVPSRAEQVQALDPQNAGPTSNWTSSAEQPDPSQVAPQSTEPTAQDPQAQAAAGPPQTEVTYSDFYSSLSPYGRWMEVEGYGLVWQPTVAYANNGWSPYYDGGRWLYTDRGWYWASDYSWGWAPFHYGRWFRHYNAGWCWMPDLVWGPSWVTWRYNDVYCGWAPLPPAAAYYPGVGFTYYGTSVGFGFGFGLGWGSYSYVHWDNFHHHHGHHNCGSGHHYHHNGQGNHLHAVPHDRKQDIYNNTRSVTRIVGDKNQIINEGVSAQRVAAATRTEVRPMRIREARSPEAVRSGRAERLDPATRTLTVYRPESPKTGDSVSGLPMERVRSGYRPTAARVNLADSGASTQPRDTTTTAAREVAGQSTRVESRGTRNTTPAVAPQNGGTEAPVSSAVRQVEGRSSRQPQTASSSVKPETRVTRTPATPSSQGADQKNAVEPAKPADQLANQSPDNKGERTAKETVVPPVRPRTPRPQSQVAGNSSVQAQQQPRVETRPPQSSLAEVRNTPSVPNMPSVEAPKPTTPQSQTRSSSPGQSPAVVPATPQYPASPASPRTAQTPSRMERSQSQLPAASQNVAPQVRQPNVWSSPRVPQTAVPNVNSGSSGSRSFSTPSHSVPPTTSQRQYSASSSTPSVPHAEYSAPTGQRQYSAPTAQRQYSAPTAQQPYSAPTGQRQYSAPTAQRQYSAPTAQQPYSAPTAQRQYSAPTGQRQYSAQSAAPPRSYSAPAPAQSAPSRSYSAPSVSSQPSYSAPQRSYSSPSSSSSGGSSSSSQGRAR